MPLNLDQPKFERARRKREYAELFAALEATPGRWASLALDDIAGPTTAAKQSAIWSLGRQRGFRVQTTVQDGRLYARIIPPKEAADGNGN